MNWYPDSHQNSVNLFLSFTCIYGNRFLSLNHDFPVLHFARIYDSTLNLFLDTARTVSLNEFHCSIDGPKN